MIAELVKVQFSSNSFSYTWVLASYSHKPAKYGEYISANRLCDACLKAIYMVTDFTRQCERGSLCTIFLDSY